MVKTKSGIGVVMNDTLFQRGIAELKELDLANGRFENELAISLSDKTSKDFLVSLNLMRGDKDGSIGQTISSFNRGGAFTCLSAPSNVGTLVGCAITPRS
ncbi:hypothetical protein DIE07_12505 [Burkholderia sp. Bp9002]|nr:hypothetical protein DIE07_12505 [Burkholderia sp. Bp9002]